MGDANGRLDPQDTESIARRCAAICADTKAEEIVLYDVRKTSVLADYYLVCNGGSDPHLRALKNHLEKELSDAGVRARHVSGTPSSHWMILDFGCVLVHLFHPDQRDYYKLEDLWDPAQIVPLGDDVAR